MYRIQVGKKYYSFSSSLVEKLRLQYRQVMEQAQLDGGNSKKCKNALISKGGLYHITSDGDCTCGGMLVPLFHGLAPHMVNIINDHMRKINECDCIGAYLCCGCTSIPPYEFYEDQVRNFIINR